MDKNKQIAELLETGCYVDYTSDAGKIAILRAMRRKGELVDFLEVLYHHEAIPVDYLLDDTGILRDKAIKYLTVISNTLVLEPRHRINNCLLTDELKHALRNEYGNGYTYLEKSDIPCLARLRDTGIDGADKLIEAIEKYGVVCIREVV